VFYTTLLAVVATSVSAQTCLIKPNTVGAIHGGMTIRQARQALPGTAFKPSEDKDQLTIFVITREGKPVMDLYPDQEDRVTEASKVELIRVYDPACSTAEGVHPGMPLRDLEKYFGKLSRMALYEGEPTERAEFSKLPSWLDIQSSDAGIYPQGKRCTGRFKDSATIQSLWVARPIQNKIPEDPAFCSAPLDKK
jgi:hypothetical protein